MDNCETVHKSSWFLLIDVGSLVIIQVNIGVRIMSFCINQISNIITCARAKIIVPWKNEFVNNKEYGVRIHAVW